MCQYPQDKTKDVKMPVELRINIWLGLSAVEKKFNSFAEGTFSVFAEMVCSSLLPLNLDLSIRNSMKLELF